MGLSHNRLGDMRAKPLATLLLASAWALCSTPALAAPSGPIAIGEATLDPQLNARLRFEQVDQDGFATDAAALTLRARIGAELKLEGFSLFAEGETTAALIEDYNDTLPFNGVEPFPVVPDPGNVELNRLQVSYIRKGTGVTVGRQRIVLDDARFVGNVGWRQNEQTFDAVRGQGKAGPFVLDATYSFSQRTVFGLDSPNAHFDGDLVFLNGGIDLSVIDAKTFAYLIDFDARPAFSSQTYGVLLTAEIQMMPAIGKVAALVSYARQSDHGANPTVYDATYIHTRLGASLFGFRAEVGYEELGSDRGVAAFQTPLATLHAFNGWADMFLTTPAAGLRDYYATVGRTMEIAFLPGLKADVTYHRFESDFGGRRYGSEWDASLGFKLGPIAVLAKYANYAAETFAADTQKFWLQSEITF